MPVSEDTKADIYRMLSIHPSDNWYRQCLDMHCTAEEISELENDTVFLGEVKSILFIEKQKLMAQRKAAIKIAADRGNWKGYDKLLQEVDSELFGIKQDIEVAGKNAGPPLQIVLKGRSSDDGSTDC